MKKIITLSIFLFFILIPNITFGVESNQVDQGKQNLGIISSFFSAEMFLNIIFSVIVIFLTFILSKVFSSKLSNFLEQKSNGENREELIGVLSRTTNITILFVGFAITLTILGVDMGIFLGGFGFGLGFTLKIFLSNFISGIIMVTQGTYHNGDLVQLEDGKMGHIRRIHALFTAIEQFDGVVYYVPNVKFLEENVSNYNSNDKRRVEIHVGVDYASDIVKAKRIMLQIIGQFPNVLNSPEPIVTVDRLDESSVNLILRFWIPAEGGEYLKTKSNVTETVHLAFRQSGIRIPFPQMTISNREEIPTVNKA